MGEEKMTDDTNQMPENGEAFQTSDDVEEDEDDDMTDYGKVFFNYSTYRNNFRSWECRGLHRLLWFPKIMWFKVWGMWGLHKCMWLEACSLGSALHTVYFNFTDFVSLDLQLNELNLALDALEQKNDHIHAQLIDLLESNRETRQLFQKNLTDEQKLDPQV